MCGGTIDKYIDVLLGFLDLMHGAPIGSAFTSFAAPMHAVWRELDIGWCQK
jgi:hypothetical protein